MGCTLITRVARLRSKLLSHWRKRQSTEESTQIILLEFLKLPKINWQEVENMVGFYAVKEQFGVDSGAAELVLCLQRIVPNLRMVDVLVFVEVLLYNSLDFGFNSDDSSSNSNEFPPSSTRNSSAGRGCHSKGSQTGNC